MEFLQVFTLFTLVVMPSAGPQGSLSMTGVLPAVEWGSEAFLVHPAAFFLAVPDPSPDRGMGKVGTGRGFSRLGKNRSFPPVGTGRGFGSLGTGRGFGSTGTGRGFARLGTGRGMAGMGSDRGKGDPPPKNPKHEENDPPDHGTSSAGGGTGFQGGRDGGTITSASSSSSSVGSSGGGVPGAGAGRNARPPSGKAPAKLSGVKASFSWETRDLVRKGDLELGKKHYVTASRWYFAAQQAEGYRGRAGLRMAAALLCMERYSDAANYLHIFLEEGGRITPRDFPLPHDPALEKRLEARLARAPFNTDLLVCAAIYRLSRADGKGAEAFLQRLDRAFPRHGCLQGLREAVERAGKEGGGKGTP